MKTSKSSLRFFAAFLLIAGMTACSATRNSSAAADPVNLVAGDYANLNMWAAHPQKQDPSDLVPRPLQKNYSLDTTVDVFFVHPTSFTGNQNGRWNADLNDAELNQKTDKGSIKFQASVFNRYPVYAPRYRQAYIDSYYTSDTALANAAFELAYQDVKTAFQFYLDHYNHGKPIIIASHSQGTTHTKRLLKEFFENKPLQKQLVAAYILGMAVEPDYFASLPPCRDSLATGCFIAWRTFRRGSEPGSKAWVRNSVVVNPLNWRTDTLYAPVSLHKGAVLTKFNKVYKKVDDAQVHNDLLWISRPKFPYSRFYHATNYHVGDINLFYLNIRTNVDERVQAFKQQQ